VQPAALRGLTAMARRTVSRRQGRHGPPSARPFCRSQRRAPEPQHPCRWHPAMSFVTKRKWHGHGSFSLASCLCRRRCRSFQATRRSLKCSRPATAGLPATRCVRRSTSGSSPSPPFRNALSRMCPSCSLSHSMVRLVLRRKVQQGDRVTVHATGTVKETGKKFWSTKACCSPLPCCWLCSRCARGV